MSASIIQEGLKRAQDGYLYILAQYTHLGRTSGTEAPRRINDASILQVPLTASNPSMQTDIEQTSSEGFRMRILILSRHHADFFVSTRLWYSQRVLIAWPDMTCRCRGGCGDGKRRMLDAQSRISLTSIRAGCTMHARSSDGPQKFGHQRSSQELKRGKAKPGLEIVAMGICTPVFARRACRNHCLHCHPKIDLSEALVTSPSIC